jgi:signal peptidase I
MGKTEAYLDLGLVPPAELEQEAAAYNSPYGDFFARAGARCAFLRGAYPHDSRYRALTVRHRNIFVPEGRLLPLGDNRDNSHDGRFFGTVKVSGILGQGSFKYWPYYRIGGIR